MKIIHIISGLGLGGVESILHQLLSKMSKNGDEHHVISLLDKGEKGQEISDLGIAVHELHAPSPASLFRLRKIMKTIQPDLIVGWMYHGNLVALLAAKMSPGKVPVCWNIHHSLHDLSTEKWMTRQVIQLNRIFSSKAKAIVYIAESGAAHHESIGFDSERTTIIPNGFDCDLFHPTSGYKKNEIRKSLGLDLDAFLIGLIARYHPVKDQQTFLKAARVLLDQRSDTKFVMAGTGIEHSNKELQSLIEKLGLSSSIKLLGECHQVPDLMAALDILSLSSVSEAFPNVLGEAMACGVPCVATDVGDCTKLIAKAGCVVPVKDPDAMAAAWTKILDSDEEQRVELSRYARKRIESEFSISGVVKKHEELYHEVVGLKIIER